MIKNILIIFMVFSIVVLLKDADGGRINFPPEGFSLKFRHNI